LDFLFLNKLDINFIGILVAINAITTIINNFDFRYDFDLKLPLIFMLSCWCSTSKSGIFSLYLSYFSDSSNE